MLEKLNTMSEKRQHVLRNHKVDLTSEQVKVSHVTSFLEHSCLSKNPAAFLNLATTTCTVQSTKFPLESLKVTFQRVVPFLQTAFGIVIVDVDRHASVNKTSPNIFTISVNQWPPSLL
jgi:hypothetical protein